MTEAVSNLVILHNNCKAVLIKRVFTHARTAIRAPFIISLLLSLSACATISKEECLNGYWEEIGFRDGTNGRTSDYLQKPVRKRE